MVQVIDKSKEKTKLKLIKQKQSYNIVIPKNVEEKNKTSMLSSA